MGRSPATEDDGLWSGSAVFGDRWVQRGPSVQRWRCAMAAGSPQDEGAACFVAPQRVNHRRDHHKIVKWSGTARFQDRSGVAWPRSAKVLCFHAVLPAKCMTV